MSNSHKAVYAIVSVLWAAYLVLTLAAPVAPSPYVLSDTVRLLLNFSIVVPFLAVWLAGFYAGLTLLATVPSMRDKEDKLAFSRLAIGVFALATARMLNTLVGALRPYYPPVSAGAAFLTILANYIEIAGPLVGFAFIVAGSAHLRRADGRLGLPSRSAALQPQGQGTIDSWSMALGFAFIAYAVLYVWLVFTNDARQFAPSPSVPPTYFLPDALIVATIILPVLVSCVLSFVSIMRLRQYYRGVSGEIYKQSTMHFIRGFLFAIAGAIMLQALLSLGTNRLLGLGLAPLLAAIYAFLALKTFGFLSMALGARKLAIIERVMQKYEAKAAKT